MNLSLVLPSSATLRALLLTCALLLLSPALAAAGPPGLQWSAPKQIDGTAPFTSGFIIERVSCPTTTFCAAIDRGGNVMVSTNPGAGQWTIPLPIGGGLVDIDCPAANRCVVIDNVGDVITSTNPTGGAGAWTKAAVGAGELTSLSCPTTTFCAAVGGGGQVVTSTNPTGGAVAWTKAQTTAAERLSSVTCASPTFCATLADRQNAIYTSTNPAGGPSAWTRRVVGTDKLTTLACPAADLCVAGGYDGALLSATAPAAGVWTKVTKGYQVIWDLDCASATFCAAATGWGGEILTTTNPTAGTWSGKELVPAGSMMMMTVSCASSALCVGADSKGTGHISTSPLTEQWTESKISGFNVLNAVSCASVSFCAATDDAGRVLTSTNPSGTWSSQMIDSATPLRDIECPASNLCVAIGGVAGVRASTNPAGGVAAWPQFFVNTIHELVAVSCPSAGFCAIIDSSGNVFTSTNPAGGAATWTRTYIGPISQKALACASSSLCAIGDGGGGVRVSTNPAGAANTWVRAQLDTMHQVGVPNAISGLSCPTTTFCAATDISQRVHTTTNPTGGGDAWKATRLNGTIYPDEISCPTSGFCAGIDTLDGTRVFSSATPNGGAADWATRTPPTDRLSAIDCVSATQCLAVTGRGELVIGTPAGPQPLTIAKQGPGTVTSAPAGIACGSTCSRDFTDGATVTLTASPAAGARFAGWGGACSGTALSCQVDVTGATTVTATFAATATLTVSKAGSGAGTVTGAPAGIACGATCSFAYDQGTKVTLTASAAAGSTFTGWSGACTGTAPCEVTLAAAAAATATFVPMRTLRIDAWNGGSGSGRVTGPGGIDCTRVCDTALPDGTTLTLTATADQDSRFAGWSGLTCAAGPPGSCTFTLRADTSFFAVFTVVHTLTVAKTGPGAGTVAASTGGIACGATCSAVYDQGTSVTLTATPAAGSTFAGWSGGGCSGTGACTTAVNRSGTVTADFALEAVATPTPTPTPTPEATSTPTPTPTPEATPTATPAATPPGVLPGPVPTAQPTPAPQPDTRLGKKSVKQRMATFRFTATAGAKTFRCALTARGKKVVYKACKSPVSFKRLKPGKYTFRVAAVGDPTPATATITVKKGRA